MAPSHICLPQSGKDWADDFLAFFANSVSDIEVPRSKRGLQYFLYVKLAALRITFITT